MKLLSIFCLMFSVCVHAAADSPKSSSSGKHRSGKHSSSKKHRHSSKHVVKSSGGKNNRASSSTESADKSLPKPLDKIRYTYEFGTTQSSLIEFPPGLGVKKSRSNPEMISQSNALLRVASLNALYKIDDSSVDVKQLSAEERSRLEVLLLQDRQRCDVEQLSAEEKSRLEFLLLQDRQKYRKLAEKVEVGAILTEAFGT